MTIIRLQGMRDGARTQGDEYDGTSSEMDDFCLPALGDEWKSWRMHDPELESDEIG